MTKIVVKSKNKCLWNALDLFCPQAINKLRWLLIKCNATELFSQ